MMKFTGERIVPGADNCEPLFADKMYQEHVARYAFASQWISGKRVLDVGCGVGYGSSWMAQNGAASVRAFDLSLDAVAHAQKFYAHESVTFEVASATDFDFGEKFDVVTCFELIEHVDAQREVIQCIRRALKDDGVLIISTPRALAEKRTNFHTKEFSEQEFRDLLGENFSRVRFFFENNHFGSLITDQEPKQLDRILALKDQYSLSQADYFIAVASMSTVRVTEQTIAPVLVLGDDAYVTLLERDVGILQSAEMRLKDELKQKNSDIAKGEQHAMRLEQDIEALRDERDRATGALNQKIVEDAKISKHLVQLEREIGTLREAQVRFIDELRRQSVKKDPAENDRLESQRRALEIARSDISYLNDVVAAMRASKSWQVTAPLRFVGGQIRQPMRILRKVREFQRMYGTRALVGAIRRRLGAGGSHGLHTLSIGAPKTEHETLADQHFDVIFCIGCWEGESKRYRVYNLAEGLKESGARVKVMPYEHVANIARGNVSARAVVLFRAAYDAAVGVDEFLTYARVRGIKVIFDVDDLVFEPEIIDQIDGFKTLSQTEQTQYIDGVHRYRKLLLAADLVTVPTEYLRGRVERLGRTALVIPNSINSAQQEIAAQLATEPKIAREVIRIGYFSGSRTHQADFAQCADALLQVMTEYPNTVLRIVGYLDLDARWEALSERVERIDFQPFTTMLRVLDECDINIAPLELDSVFCHGKSELKFFEAGLLGVPTIASATDTYERAIEAGIDGFLARNSAEWTDCLRRLVTSSELRAKVGAMARETAIRRFSIREVAKTASAIYGLDVISSYGDSIEDSGVGSVPIGAFSPDKLRISWVIPGLIIGGGGHRNILRAAYFLSKFGHQISLYFLGTEKDPGVIKRQIQEHFYPIECAVYLFEGKIRPCDVVFATHWSTVSAALTARDSSKEIMYFVQDFEPAFSPMGSEYVLAENTYRLGLYHITSGPWCEALLRRDFGAAADHFQFPVDRSIYYPRERSKANRNLVFFAKPEMPRRCFELGVMALREFHKLRPDVEIIMFGSKHAAKQSYDFPVTVREVLPTLDDLAQMYSDGDVGLVFSTTNPSLIPYEMIACGLPVIDLARGDNAVNYGGRTDIALLADPQPRRMAEQIAGLLGDSTELAVRREKGLAFVKGFPSEEGMARRIENLIISRVKEQSR